MTDVFDVRNVVVATGLFQRPKIPAVSRSLPSEVTQVASGQYRNPASIPDGAVLVVGSAQSGAQIAEELYLSGRQVYLCVGSAGRVPRRYRGRDIFDWMTRAGLLDRTVADLPSPSAKFAANPHVSGRDGGRTLNLHKFALDGVVLLGHLRAAQSDTILLEPDVRESLLAADYVEADMLRRIDDYIDREALEAPDETLPVFDDRDAVKDISSLSLSEAGITTVIWATGYTFDFSLVRLPVVDSDGYPIQERGVTSYPGLYFVGMPWLDGWKSGLLIGVGDHAEHIATAIETRSR